MEAAINKFFVKLFEKAACEHGVGKEDISLLFLLKNEREYVCQMGSSHIILSDQDIREHFKEHMNLLVGPSMVRAKINGFIVEALLRFCKGDGIEKKAVNVWMTMSGEEFILMLRNGARVVRPVRMQEIIT